MTTPPRHTDALVPDPLARLGASLAERPYARRGVAVSSETIRVLLADDHTLVREGLAVLLRAAPDISVVGGAENGEAALAMAKRLAPDLVVLDLDMPGTDGNWALRELQQAVPNVRVLILTMHAERDRLVALLEAGASGYLTKEAASRDLVDAIRIVATGEIYVRPATARLLAAAVVPQKTAESARGRFHSLSDREQTILQSVAQGFSGAEISRTLGISSKTVDAYKRRIEDKLGLAHRTDYVKFAIEAGLLGR